MKETEKMIVSMEEFFIKFPPLPVPWKEIIVKITPILSLIFGILGILITIAGFGALAFLAPLAVLGGGLGTVGGNFLSAIFYFAASVLMVMAYAPLKERKKRGWELLFWSEFSSIISSIVTLSLTSALIGALIGFYILFQIKSYYK